MRFRKIAFATILYLISSASDAHLATSDGAVSPGFFVLGEYAGDLNGDGIVDKILVIASEGEAVAEEGQDNYYRKLIILFGLKRGGFEKVFENSRAVLCRSCGGIMGDPFVLIDGQPPYFTVHHYGGSAWRWGLDVIFKYDKSRKDFYLFKIVETRFHTADPDKQIVEVKTRRNFGLVPLRLFDIYSKAY